MVDSVFPWNDLKAESLRAVCRDLGMRGPRKRDEMIGFLELVQKQGLNAALEADVPPPPRVSSAKIAVTRTPSKRKAETTPSGNHDYGTRNRGKRVRVYDPGPVRRRAPKATPKPAAPKPEVDSPSKHSTKKPTSGRREVFDGVMLLSKPTSHRGKGKEKESSPPQADLDLEYPPHNGSGEADEVLEGLRETSSLGGSNKENESLNGDHEVAHGEPEEGGTATMSTSLFHPLQNEIFPEDPDELEGVHDEHDLDAEGEIVAETDLMVDAESFTYPHEEDYREPSLSSVPQDGPTPLV